MDLKQLIAKQEELGLGDYDLVYLAASKFFIAHTDEERAEGLEAMADCTLYDWLDSCGGPPEPVGFYIAVTDDWEKWELVLV